MKHTISFLICGVAALFLVGFSSQDSTVNGGVKPAVNFYGEVTDTSDFSFNAENITFDGLYKQIPVYQIPPKDAPANYDPAVNITRLDLSEILTMTVDHAQSVKRYGNRDYLFMHVISKDNEKTKNTYLIEADKKLRCDQKNNAGPIEKEIKFKALLSVTFGGYKQPVVEPEKKPVKAAHSKASKKERLIAYVQDLFGAKKSL